MMLCAPGDFNRYQHSNLEVFGSEIKGEAFKGVGR